MSAETDHAELNDLLVNCPELAELEEKLGGFNVFEVLKFEYGEIRHSNVLAWLFDPGGSHGLDDSFLKKWLMRALHEAESATTDLTPIDIDAWNVLGVEVRREWRSIDILILIETLDRQRFAVCIENKVKSKQHSNQLARYRRIVETEIPPGYRKLYFFLTKDPEIAEESSFVSTSYAQIHRALKESLSARRSSVGEEPAMLINNYLKLLEERFMNESEVARLALKIYQQHKRALDVIFENRPDNLKLISDRLQELLRHNSADLGIIVEASTKSAVRFIPREWDVPQNTRGNGWSGTNRTLIIEINLTGKRPYMLFYAGKPPEDWIAPLWQRCLQPPFNPGRRLKASPKSWFKLHVHPKTISLDDEDTEAALDTAERTFQWIAEALSLDRTREVIAILAEELRRLPD